MKRKSIFSFSFNFKFSKVAEDWGASPEMFCNYRDSSIFFFREVMEPHVLNSNQGTPYKENGQKQEKNPQCF